MKTEVIEHEWKVIDEAGTETNYIVAIRRPEWEYETSDGKPHVYAESFEVGDSRTNSISVGSVEEAIAYAAIFTKVAGVLADEQIAEAAAKKEAE